jgi:polysaccharide biosynthesis/export protein
MKINKHSIATVVIVAFALAGCASSFISQSGPAAEDVVSRVSETNKAKLVEVDEQVLQQLSNELEGGQVPLTKHWVVSKPALTLGEGDIIQISIWEAPPAVLFGGAGTLAGDMSLGSGASSLNLPEQMIAEKGTLVVPFAGELQASGRTLSQIEADIRFKLGKIANKPQVIARLIQNSTNVATVVVDGLTKKLLLTSKGERLIDVLPLVADIKKVKGALLTVERRGVTHTVSVDKLTKNPVENFYMMPGDVVMVLSEPYSATVLGASNVNGALKFGDDGLSVAEAIGKVSGINSNRANTKGVFVFRPVKATSKSIETGKFNLEGADTLPIVYQLDMSTAKGVFLAQGFNLIDKDTIYIAESASVGLKKVLSIVASVLSVGVP